MSYDSPNILKDFAEKNDIDYRLLSDKDSKVIDAFKVRNTSFPKGSRRDGIPHPGTFVVNHEGKVVGKIFYTVIKRHTSEELLKVVKELRDKQGSRGKKSESDKES